jgi:hypothetical protein
MARNIPTLKAKSRFKQRLFFGLIFRPLRLFCKDCDKYVPSDMAWRCSYCNRENTRTKLYSFLHKCQQCKRSPKSFACPHCESLNFLDKDDNGSHPARSTAAPCSPTLKVDPRAEKRRAHDEQKEALEQAIVIARLDAELTAVKASTEIGKETSAPERLEKSYSDHDAHVLAAHRIAKRERESNAKKYKDDPEFREMADQSVQCWLEQQL